MILLLMREGCCSGTPRRDGEGRGGREKLCRCGAVRWRPSWPWLFPAVVEGHGRVSSHREVKLYWEGKKFYGSKVRKSITIAEAARRKHGHSSVTQQNLPWWWRNTAISNGTGGSFRIFCPFKIRVESILHKEIAVHLISLSPLQMPFLRYCRSNDIYFDFYDFKVKVGGCPSFSRGLQSSRA